MTADTTAAHPEPAARHDAPVARGPRGPRGPYAKSSERRAAIVDAAFEVFSTRGYRGGSLQEVADRVGVSQTGLLHYFPSKRDLLRAVLERRDSMASGAVRDGTTDGDFIEGVLRQARHNETVPGLIALYAVLAGEAATEDAPVRGYVATRFEGLRAEYTAGFRDLESQGRLRPGVDPARAASGLVALWDGIQLQWLIDPSSVDVEQQLRDHLGSLVLPG
ncbi:TetR/AcrR family transcriptional regulator [Frigoribacterium sp. CFBP9039]|uniref:TetR/AcrR family transcriptional regulator n=1 Tax=Frigoribacterium TaxID=96492 RepID=UPI00178632ED|nr:MULTISPECIES: TetR/AcrR family transcriptional regulator [Frigoribacterium]MBD8703650.1 TetR/AcrR family transcriptional regulator [Frigoribacterium sp. CFBP 13712]MCJ0701163.1 TetR/AcrR family transcriptional regulator [Frigoribacterium faeni]MDY0890840.1 TetR/AcrR family transcriptional regulator [Frigoribacterium sp. CFBP9030]MDY0945200.1 TetR/AcrR family transcriptional regulator [Frigoribacterium sp. CFBP9039]